MSEDTERKMAAMRFSRHTRELILLLAKHHDMSRTAVVEYAIRNQAKADKLSTVPKRPRGRPRNEPLAETEAQGPTQAIAEGKQMAADVSEASDKD